MNTMIEMRPSSIGVAIAIEKVRDVVDAILEARAAADQSTNLKLFLYNDRMNSRAVVQAALAKVRRDHWRKGERRCALYLKFLFLPLRCLRLSSILAEREIDNDAMRYEFLTLF